MNVTRTQTQNGEGIRRPEPRKRPPFGEHATLFAQVLLLMGAILGVLWLLDQMVNR